MSSTGLWLARLLPILGLAAQIAGSIRLFRETGDPLGLGLMAAAWAGLVLYSAVFHFRGDFIQRALNLGVKPGCGDELQRDKARLAYTIGYIAILLVSSGLIGAFMDVFLFAETTDPVEIARAGQALFAGFLSVLYLGAAVPTLFLGWTMKRLAEDMAE